MLNVARVLRSSRHARAAPADLAVSARCLARDKRFSVQHNRNHTNDLDPCRQLVGATCCDYESHAVQNHSLVACTVLLGDGDHQGPASTGSPRNA